jgi:hypothetical protein
VSSTGARVSGLWKELERERKKGTVLGFPRWRGASYKLQGRWRLSWASKRRRLIGCLGELHRAVSVPRKTKTRSGKLAWAGSGRGLG